MDKCSFSQVNHHQAQVNREAEQVTNRMEQVKRSGKLVTDMPTQVNSFHPFKQDFMSIVTNLIEE